MALTSQQKALAKAGNIDVSKRAKGQSAREYITSKTPGGVLDYGSGKITVSKNTSGSTAKPAPSTPSKVTSLDSAKSFINANQLTDAAKADSSAPTIRSSVQKYADIATELGLGDKLSGLGADAPALPQYEQSYLGLRSDYGVDTLETKLNDLTAQEEALAEQARVNKGAEQGKAVAMGVIEGRVSEEQKAAQDQMDFINRQKNTVTNELNTKYNVINQLIQFKGMDYEAAKGRYDTQFSQAVQTFNLVKGIDDSMKTEAQHIQDSARANLQIVYNNIAANPDGYKSLDKGTQTMVAKLELQAGLPVGTFTSIASKNPGGEIVTTNNWQAADGKNYISVVTRDPKTGALKTTNQLLGQGKVAGSGGSGTESAEIDKFYAQADKLIVEMTKGGPGAISWSDAWSRLQSQFPSAGIETIDNALGLKNRAKYDK